MEGDWITGSLLYGRKQDYKFPPMGGGCNTNSLLYGRKQDYRFSPLWEESGLQVLSSKGGVDCITNSLLYGRRLDYRFPLWEEKTGLQVLSSMGESWITGGTWVGSPLWEEAWLQVLSSMDWLIIGSVFYGRRLDYRFFPLWEEVGLQVLPSTGGGDWITVSPLWEETELQVPLYGRKLHYWSSPYERRLDYRLSAVGGGLWRNRCATIVILKIRLDFLLEQWKNCDMQALLYTVSKLVLFQFICKNSVSSVNKWRK